MSLTHDSVAISAEDFEKQINWFEVPSEEEGVTVRMVGSDQKPSTKSSP
jgi:hypothetical protein